jgi:hypothetical protein
MPSTQFLITLANEFWLYLISIQWYLVIRRGDRVPIEEWANEFVVCGLHKLLLEDMWSESEG